MRYLAIAGFYQGFLGSRGVMTRSFLAQRLGSVSDPGQRQPLLVIGHLNCVDDIGRNRCQMKG